MNPPSTSMMSKSSVGPMFPMASPVVRGVSDLGSQIGAATRSDLLSIRCRYLSFRVSAVSRDGALRRDESRTLCVSRCECLIECREVSLSATSQSCEIGVSDLTVTADRGEINVDVRDRVWPELAALG